MNDRHISNLCFADDILLLATSNGDAICMLEILILELLQIYFILNTKKAKDLTTQVHDFHYIVLHHVSYIDDIADFECHRWLEKAICFSKCWIHDHASRSRIAAATRAFYIKKHILRAKNIPSGFLTISGNGAKRSENVNSNSYEVLCVAGLINGVFNY